MKNHPLCKIGIPVFVKGKGKGKVVSWRTWLKPEYLIVELEDGARTKCRFSDVADLRRGGADELQLDNNTLEEILFAPDPRPAKRKL